MSSISRNARVAGCVYLLLAIALFRLMYIPSILFVRGDATATANNIAAHEMLFRFGILSELLTGIIVIFLVLALYRLLKDVDRGHAVLMVILGGLMPAPIYLLNALNDVAALLLARGADFLTVFDGNQLNALALFFLRLHHHGDLVNGIFWGLWLFPFGVLVYRSGFLPRFLGIWLIINGFAYLPISFAGLLLPRYENLMFKIAFPALLGEMAIMLWLLIMGAKPQTANVPALRS